jgi:glycosyltransferase involved in cell wall biosynthesis
MERKIKLLMISSSSLLKKFYQTLPLEIVKQTGWSTKVIVPPFKKDRWMGEKKILEKENSDYFNIIKCHTILGGNISLYGKRLKQSLQSFQPTIIDLENQPESPTALQLVNLKNRFCPQSKIIFHSQTKKRFFLNPLSKFIEIFCLKHANGIITSDNNIYYHYSKQMKGIPLKLIPQGVNTDVFRPRELPELSRKINPKNKKVIGYIGEIKNKKNFQFIIRNLSNLDYKILVINEANFKKEIEYICKKNFIDATIISNASHEEIAQYLNCMNILIVPQIDRTHPIQKTEQIMLEAMASGVPVIVGKTKNTLNIAYEPVLTYYKSNSIDLREKLTLLLENPLILRTLGWKGRKIVQNYFSWEKVATKTVNFYQELQKKKN